MVLGLIALIVGYSVGKLTGIFGSQQIRITKLFVTNGMDTPLIAYKLDMGSYPSTDEGLMALYVAPQDKADNWHGPYAKGNKPPSDPWGRPYHYVFPGTHNKDGYDLWSTGPSGTDGGSDNITNW